MDFFISNAYAQAEPTAGSTLMGLMPLVVMIILFYLLLLRPQMKRQKEHRNLLAAISKGDEIVTNGGLMGKVSFVGESYVQVDLAEGVSVKLQKQAVAQVLPKGSLKSAE